MIRVVLCSIFAALSLTFAATEFDVSSSISKSRIYQDQTTVLSLNINGAEEDIYKDVQLPDLIGTFTIISSSQASSLSYVNGVINRNKEYRYIIKPIKEGIFIIDPFIVKYKGKQYNKALTNCCK